MEWINRKPSLCYIFLFRERENLEPDWIAEIHVVGSVVQEQWRAVGKGVSRSPGLMGRVSVREPWHEDSPSTETPCLSLHCPHTVPHARQREHYIHTHKWATIIICKWEWLVESVAAGGLCGQKQRDCLAQRFRCCSHHLHSGLFTQA